MTSEYDYSLASKSYNNVANGFQSTKQQKNLHQGGFETTNQTPVGVTNQYTRLQNKQIVDKIDVAGYSKEDIANLQKSSAPIKSHLGQNLNIVVDGSTKPTNKTVGTVINIMV